MADVAGYTYTPQRIYATATTPAAVVYRMIPVADILTTPRTFPVVPAERTVLRS